MGDIDKDLEAWKACRQQGMMGNPAAATSFPAPASTCLIN